MGARGCTVLLAVANYIFQFTVHNLTTQLTTVTVSGINIAAGSPSSEKVTGSYTIPASTATGYLRVAFGAFTSGWSNLFWEENIFEIGVNKIVGS